MEELRIDNYNINDKNTKKAILHMIECYKKLIFKHDGKNLIIQILNDKDVQTP